MLVTRYFGQLRSEKYEEDHKLGQKGLHSHFLNLLFRHVLTAITDYFDTRKIKKLEALIEPLLAFFWEFFRGGQNLLLCKFLLLCYCFRTKFQGGAKIFRGANCLRGAPPAPPVEESQLWNVDSTIAVRNDGILIGLG